MGIGVSGSWKKWNREKKGLEREVVSELRYGWMDGLTTRAANEAREHLEARLSSAPPV